MGQIGANIGHKIGQSGPSANLSLMSLRSINVLRRTILRWKLLKLFGWQSYFRTKIGQKGVKIGHEIGQSGQSANLSLMSLGSIYVLRNMILRWKLFKLFQWQSYFRAKIGQIGAKTGHKIGQSGQPKYSVRKAPMERCVWYREIPTKTLKVIQDGRTNRG